MNGLVDIGANLLSEQFDADRPDVLTRARTAGVERIVITASNLASVPRILGFIDANRHRGDWPILHSTAGIHPHDAARAGTDFEKSLRDWFGHGDVVSAGETGLDYYRNISSRAEQRRVFEAQIEAARDCDMPLFVHDRESAGETLELLNRSGIAPERVVIHCFTGTAWELDSYLDAGFSIGITGWVCDRRRGESLRMMVRRIPLERLLVETDAPYLLPQDLPPERRPAGGRRNEPALLPHVAGALAALMDVDMSTLIIRTRANAMRFFRITA